MTRKKKYKSYVHDQRLALKKRIELLFPLIINHQHSIYLHLNRNVFVMHRTHISKSECGFCPYNLQLERRGSIHRKQERIQCRIACDKLNLLLIRKIGSRILEISFLCYYNYYLYYVFFFQKVMEVWIPNDPFWPYTMPL